jgi:hypothetical protein
MSLIYSQMAQKKFKVCVICELIYIVTSLRTLRSPAFFAIPFWSAKNAKKAQ